MGIKNRKQEEMRDLILLKVKWSRKEDVTNRQKYDKARLLREKKKKSYWKQIR